MKTAALVLFLALPAAAQVTVTGTARYEDRTYGAIGFTGTTYLPIRRAEVEIIRTSDSAVLGSGVTDETGAFSVGGIASGQTVRARIYARRSGGQINAVVRNNSSSNAIYTALTSSIDTSSDPSSLGTTSFTIASGAAPPFNIFDCAVKSFQYQAAIDADLAATPPLLTAYWESGTSDGTYFNTDDNAIHMLGRSDDPDQYDDDIILHEMGHWVASNFSKDDSPGGAHTITDVLDPRISWSEGLAHFWSSTVRRAFPSEYSAPSKSVDNFGGSSYAAFDIEPPDFAADAVMATNELSVAAILWDITDTANEGAFDVLGGAAREIDVWETLDNQIPSRTNITLEDFRVGLEAENASIIADVVGSESSTRIMNARSVCYYANSAAAPETGEPSNNGPGAPGAFGPPTPIVADDPALTQRTIYPEGDEDWYVISLTPGTLTVETLNLGDAGDTILYLYDTDKTTLLGSNDDRSVGNLSSLLQQTITTSGNYCIRVRSTGGITELGYYDIQAQLSAIAPTTVTSVSATNTSGTAPLRTTLSGVVSGPTGGYREYRWDFDGDGKYDWSSLAGSTVTAIYPRAGVFTATFCVVDTAAATSTGSVTITVTAGAAPTISVSESVISGSTPLSVDFNAAISGMVPVLYEWDFQSDGVTDSVSTATAAATFVYREAAVATARLTVRDAQGRAYRAASQAIAVSSGGTPPTITSFTSGGGSIPYSPTFSINHSDADGSISTVEWDFDGDGAYEIEMPPTSGASTSAAYEVQRARAYTARARVTDNSGRCDSETDTLTAISSGTSAWMIDPRGGDKLSGTSVTLTAEALPQGVSKVVQFQYRTDSPAGSWVNIGSAITSSGTLFSTTWNVTGLASLSVLDVRTLVNSSISSGDDSNTIVIDSSAPDIDESGDTRSKVIPYRQTTFSRNAAGVWIIVPSRSMAAAADTTITLQPATAPAANGSAAGLSLQGSAVEVSTVTTFVRPFRVRIPYSSGSNLGMYVYDAGLAEWKLPLSFTVNHSDNWVEAEATAPGIYAVFGTSSSGSSSSDGGGGGGGGGGCGGTVGAIPVWSSSAAALAILAVLACLRRR